MDTPKKLDPNQPVVLTYQQLFDYSVMMHERTGWSPREAWREAQIDVADLIHAYEAQHKINRP